MHAEDALDVSYLILVPTILRPPASSSSAYRRQSGICWHTLKACHINEWKDDPQGKEQTWGGELRAVVPQSFPHGASGL